MQRPKMERHPKEMGSSTVNNGERDESEAEKGGRQSGPWVPWQATCILIKNRNHWRILSRGMTMV